MWVAAAGAAVAGTVRGLSGFGAALLYVPIAAAVLGPQVAAATIFIIDTVVILPIVARAVFGVDWRELAPMAASAMALVPVGAWALVHVDPIPFRWFLSAAIVISLVLLVSGLRWRGPSRIDVSLGVGALAGFLSGFSQTPGPPVLVYWLGREDPGHKMRDNAFVFFCFTTVVAGIAYFFAGLFTVEVIDRSLILLPIYGVALFAGSLLAGRTSERAYRLIAYILVAIVAVLSTPAIDQLVR